MLNAWDKTSDTAFSVGTLVILIADNISIASYLYPSNSGVDYALSPRGFHSLMTAATDLMISSFITLYCEI